MANSIPGAGVRNTYPAHDAPPPPAPEKSSRMPSGCGCTVILFISLTISSATVMPFIALGGLIVPQIFELSRPVVCEEGETIEADIETYEYQGGCEGELYVVCIDRDNDERDVTGYAMVLTMGVGTAVATLGMVLLIYMGKSARRRRRDRRGS